MNVNHASTAIEKVMMINLSEDVNSVGILAAAGDTGALCTLRSTTFSKNKNLKPELRKCNNSSFNCSVDRDALFLKLFILYYDRQAGRHITGTVVPIPAAVSNLQLERCIAHRNEIAFLQLLACTRLQTTNT
ncbi:hypothetical protein GQX74_000197 [Glossina fuscipes]|nr:hypothetical protein GQX74_000197 [Glossina fuscipes]